eukprot:TRINITY_DN26_c4_g1_i1.p1 TRINITY_DN26_c4_g1~~TRINITY_DN26_c4_g1_i1.p1  ORF type:complete len:644 (+),score=60.02 TRINITY_DN26_c4_g1_i1:73-2004(+)
MTSKKVTQPYRYYLVLDFEATCEDGNYSWPHEIIEIPVVVVDSEKMEIVGKWQTYVKPVINPKLTEFCTKLTGITQETVDKAPVLKDAMLQLDKWLKQSFGADFDKPDTFTFATDGPWDFRDFYWKHSITHQKAISPTQHPYFKRWINIRTLHRRSFKNRSDSNVTNMLKDLNLVFEGRPHSGIDDAHNIAKILIGSMKRGSVAGDLEFASQYCEDEVRQLHKDIVKRSFYDFKKQPYRYYIILDFHCTCEKGNPNYDHEIIQIKSNVVDTCTMAIVDHGSTYVRPTINRHLTPFCTQITGVHQRNVDTAPTLDTAMESMFSWLTEKGYSRSCIFGSDNSMDFVKFFWGHEVEKHKKVDPSKVQVMGQWIDVSCIYGAYIGSKKPQTLKKMSKSLAVAPRACNAETASHCLLELMGRGVVAEKVFTLESFAEANDRSSGSGLPPYLLTLDFECTCEKDSHTFPHEIIDIGVCVVNTKTLRVINKWCSHVRPVLNGGKLTPFCTALTGITQADVDNASVLDTVLKTFKMWLSSNGYLDRHTGEPLFVFCTDGPWHIRDFFWSHSVRHQKAVDPSQHPYFKKFVNIRRVFARFYKYHQRNISGMLSSIGKTREGVSHNALDDASSLTILLQSLLRDGAALNYETC